MPSRSTSSTDAEPGQGRPVLGHPSAAAEAEPRLSPSGEAAAAGWRANGGSTGWCTLRAASVVGVRHRLAGQGSDDSYAWAHDQDALAVAVADGVGSRPGSAATAARACRAAVREALAVAGRSPEEAIRAAVTAANAAADAAADSGGGATTLVVALVLREGGGAIGRVGDSSAWWVGPDGAAELFEPPDPERPDTATAALPTGEPEAELRSLTTGPRTVLALLTDGLADPLRDGPATVSPALTAALRDRPDPLQLLSLADFSRKGCHDDRTIVCVWTD